ncbi:hypothetical protein HKD37_18G051028 [Glycine soja]
MATPLASPPSPPPPAVASVSLSTQKRTRKATWLRSLATRPPRAERPVVNVDPATDKVDGPHKKKLRTYLGIVARDKAEFEILKASDSRTKKKVLQTVGEWWRQFKSDLTRKWALAADKDSVDDTAIQKQNTTPHVLSRGGYDYLEQKLMVEKTKKKLEEFAQSGSTEGVINPPSPIRRHVKWKMTRTKKTGQMTSEATKEIAEKIASQGSFVPHGRQDVLTAAIGRPEHHGRVRAVGAATCSPSFSHICNPLEPEVGPSAARVSTKGSCVDPSPTDPETGDSDKCELYIEENPSRLVALGRVYEGSTAVHNIPLFHGQVKVSVMEVKDAEASIPVPTDEVQLVGQALNSFLVWPTHLVKRVSEHAAAYLAKPPDRPDPEVDDPLYLMTLTIPQLFLKPLQVMWDATMFGVFNPDFLLYIKHEDLSEIAHGNSDVYRFLKPQSIQRSGQSQFESESYLKCWMQSSKRDVYLGAYLNGPDNYLKGIINSALKGLHDTPQPKSNAGARWIVVKCNRQKGSTECGYYIMHWM